jgi:hypothetical protein
MKTNKSARQIRKIRAFFSVLAIVAITTFELSTGYYCLHNFNRNPASANSLPPGSVPNVSVGDFFAAAR